MADAHPDIFFSRIRLAELEHQHINRGLAELNGGRLVVAVLFDPALDLRGRWVFTREVTPRDGLRTGGSEEQKPRERKDAEECGDGLEEAPEDKT